MITLYHYLIQSFGNNKELEVLVPSLALTVGLTGTITFFAQRYRSPLEAFGEANEYPFQLFHLAGLETQKNIIAPIIFVFQMARLTSGWVTTVKAYEYILRLFVFDIDHTHRIEFGTFVAWTHQVNFLVTTVKAYEYILCLFVFDIDHTHRIEFGTFVAWTHQVRWIFTAGLAVAVLCDILITGSLCYWLHGSRSGVHGMNEIIDKIILYSIENGMLIWMNEIIDKIILYSIENGMLICLASVASLICGITMPGNLIFIGIHFVISKLYINSILASLNTRNSFRARKERLFINARPAGEDGPETLRYRDHNFLSTHGYVLQSPKSPRSFRSSDLAVSVKEAEQTGTSTESDFAVRKEHVV
ncbi:hypothetical protein A7U60_g3093 [Sanghuangporus baumii]|uniref:DUF6534 domain-containing protein n=1 Tax=Sanghuangporus baumii TaxID=108892 RepID=A0A9Q5N7C6_SANBA|nr:hypothetical protein A7U60_g3093 [Sanghuangporus baumii]